jgi:hypothetical protein
MSAKNMFEQEFADQISGQAEYLSFKAANGKVAAVVGKAR